MTGTTEEREEFCNPSEEERRKLQAVLDQFEQELVRYVAKRIVRLISERRVS